MLNKHDINVCPLPVPIRWYLSNKHKTTNPSNDDEPLSLPLCGDRIHHNLSSREHTIDSSSPAVRDKRSKLFVSSRNDDDDDDNRKCFSLLLDEDDNNKR